jgi:hypothetical protein
MGKESTMNSNLANRGGTTLAPQLDYVLLDGSGSMSDKWWETLAGLQNFLSVLRAENIASHGIVHVFDSVNMELIQRNSIIAEWASFIDHPLSLHGGGTPLFDAVNLMVRKLADLDPPRCSIVIITDGMENGSTYTTADQARNLLDWCRHKGWQVTFLGADFSNSKQAKLLGANESNSLAIQKMKLGEAGKLLGEKRVDYGRTGKPINFDKNEQADFGGYLTHNSPWNPASGGSDGAGK